MATWKKILAHLEINETYGMYKQLARKNIMTFMSYHFQSSHVSLCKHIRQKEKRTRNKHKRERDKIIVPF